MREMTQYEIKMCQLDELLFLDSVCKSNNIRYYLFYGTLIGAMRHKGFIPWDDDVDICIPRPDFFRLLQSIVNLDDERYEIVSMYNNKEYTAPLAKLIDKSTLLIQDYGYKEKVELGVYIDIFIIDGLPSDGKELNRYYNKAKHYSRMWALTNHKFRFNDSLIRDIARYIFYFPNHVLGYKYYLKKIKTFSGRYDFDSSEHVAELGLMVYDAVYFREDFGTMSAEFEGHMFSVPDGYDRILTECYGDWRKLPPLSQQVSHHYYRCYWRG